MQLFKCKCTEFLCKAHPLDIRVDEPFSTFELCYTLLADPHLVGYIPSGKPLVTFVEDLWIVLVSEHVRRQRKGLPLSIRGGGGFRCACHLATKITLLLGPEQ